MKFPPRPILSEADSEATQAQIDTLVDKREITQDERDYLEVLGILVCDYEQKHKPVEVLKGIELLKALIAEENLQLSDLLSIFDNEANLNLVLQRQRELTANQIKKLADLFHISASSFIE
ncbi:MAG: transcriptional regulator [Pseudanabaena sp. RU_4_16]|nr:transcriptional regulator [Pseudanabaena sp. RU_4_16]NKB17020.1 transcriptional regulator [Pseudanabaena sp. CRU_2_10]